jgi:hypothetical protein
VNHHIRSMNLDLTDEEAVALRELLRRTIDGDRFPLSPRMRPYRAILAKIEPTLAVEPLPAPKPSARPSSLLTRKRRR